MPRKKINQSTQTSGKAPVGLKRIQGRRIKVVGIGGIGSSLVSYLARYLWSQDARSFDIFLDLIDGDHYELKNKERMLFPMSQSFVSKPVAKATELAREFGDRLLVRPIPEYVSQQNVGTLVRDNDIVLLAVDNYRTRKLVSDHCQRLTNILLFSGGNDGVENGQGGTAGNIQIYQRVNGKDLCNPITRFHPEIASPDDKAPFDRSCEELAQNAAPQLLFTNLAVASALCNAFYSWLLGRLEYEEAYLDIVAGRIQPYWRELAVRDLEEPKAGR
ncbi:MAG: ThiF family adenylyltransferase [Acidobacteria bacterium]|nr:ThiF family adenylyltransferase [Acidobacteriota bacterium]